MTRHRQFLLAGLFLIIALGVMGGRPVLEPLAAAPSVFPPGYAYNTEDLGFLGGAKSFAAGLNNGGQVVGRSDTAAGDAHAFRWDPLNGMKDLGTLPGGNKSGAVAISASGLILGFSNAPDGKSHIVVYLDGHIVADLGPGVATDINVFGDVLGTQEGAPRSSLWKTGFPSLVYQTLTDVGSLGGKTTDYTDAQIFNDFEELVGLSQTAAGDFHAFLWQNGTMTDLSVLNPGLEGPFYINNLTEVACTKRLTPGVYPGVFHTVLLRPGQPMLDLTPGSNAFPNGINDQGEIAVTSGTGAAATTVLLGPDGPVGYKVLTTFPFTGVRGPSNAGQLIYNSPDHHAFVLTPVGGVTLTGPDTDVVIDLIVNLANELAALPEPSRKEARSARADIVSSLFEARTWLLYHSTPCAAGELEGALRIMKAHLPPEAGGTPERINRLKELITRLGGTPDV